MVGGGLVGLAGGRASAGDRAGPRGRCPRGSAGRRGGHGMVGQVLPPPAHGQRAVQALFHADAVAPQARLHGAALDLIALVLVLDRIVVGHGSRFLVAENRRQVEAGDRAMGVHRAGRSLGKARVVVRQELLFQEAIGFGDGADPGQAQLFDQPILQSAEAALDPAFGLSC